MIISVFNHERDNIPKRNEITWEQLVESLAHVSVSPCTLATCRRAECQEKKIQAWSPASWPEGETRAKATVEAVSCLVCDLDHVPALELDAHLERLERYASLLHSSHSDRPDDRCVRVVVQLSRPVAGSDFPRFWRAAVDHLGLPVDEATKDASRLYFMPSRPSDACGDSFDGQGYDYVCNEGPPLDVDALFALVPPEVTHEVTFATIPFFHGAPSQEACSAAVRILAAAWPERGRHQAQLALSGALARAGWPVELVAEFCAAVAEQQEPGNGCLEKRLFAACSSLSKLEAGEAVVGWPTVAEHAGQEAVTAVTQALGLGGPIAPDPVFTAAMTRSVQRHAGVVTRLELKAAIERDRDRLKKSKVLEAILDAKLLTKVLKGEPLTEHADEDREKALVQAAIAVVRAAPVGTTPELLYEVLLTPAGRLACDVEDVVSLAIAHVKATERVTVDEAEPSDDEALRAQLELDREGRTRGSGDNIERIIRFSRELRGQLRFNVITKQIEVLSGRFMKENPGGLPTGIKNWLGSHWALTTSTTEVADQLLRVAQLWCTYDPVAEYLRSLVWDGVSRIGCATGPGWLTTYCRVQDTSYVRKVSARFLISAVARALDPGCKVDTVLVLEGDQGARKSTTLSILGGEWFTDTPMVLGDKDSRLLAASKWIVELGELKSLLRNDEASKGFLSQCYDDFRPPYGRAPEKFERRCVFAGSTNEYEYLQDPTGNRRYWAVRTGQCDTESLLRDRDQLWAEAAHRYLGAHLNPDQADVSCCGERWWFDAHEQAEADEVIAQRRSENPWVPMILSWTAIQMRQLGAQPPRTNFTLPEIAEFALKIAAPDMQRYNRQISQALREAGFTSAVVGDKRNRVWTKQVTVLAGVKDEVYISTVQTNVASN